MTTRTLARTAGDVSAAQEAAGAVSRLLLATLIAAIRHIEAWRELRALDQLDDRLLKDIGIDRTQLRAAIELGQPLVRRDGRGRR
ncbi:MAG: DUF1127 domain-containing protein [Alphaproteobacteria bacterium]|nr:DUF1127 domain-containing protein [Alphaproteobacteria bacterium]